MPKALDVTELDLITPITGRPIADRKLLDAAAATGIAVRLKALADPLRLQLVSRLLIVRNNGLRTRDLAGAMGVTEPTVSHHLKQLLEAGLVTRHRDGASVYYRVENRALRGLARALSVT